MALVLCTGVDPALLAARKSTLEKAGHSVLTATDQLLVVAACKQHQFDVAVLGQAISPRMKRVIASLIQQYCPLAKIVELYRPPEKRALDNADLWLEAPAAVPQDFAEHVSKLVRRTKPKRVSA
jgi:CheY-like chemotaxis protein